MGHIILNEFDIKSEVFFLLVQTEEIFIDPLLFIDIIYVYFYK